MRKICTWLIFLLISFSSLGQTFDCYVANDTIISPDIYQFDVYIKATSVDFYLRTVQLGLKFNPNLFQAGAVVAGSYVPNTTELHSYNTGLPQWGATTSSLSIPANISSACNGQPDSSLNDLLAVNSPVRICTYQLTSSLPFNCTQPDISMIRPFDPAPGGVLKCSVTKWDDVCAARVISHNGTFTYYDSLILYSNVINPLDSTCLTGVPEIEKVISLYPNPSHGWLTIKGNMTGSRIRLYDSLGKLHREMEGTGFAESIDLDLQDLNSGIYYLEMYNRQFQKIILQKDN